MRAILILPRGALFSANLVDRPFLRHIVEFVVAQGIREFLVAGQHWEKARGILGAGHRWGAKIDYREVPAPLECEERPKGRSDKCLLASAICLPLFALKEAMGRTEGTIVYGKTDGQWTGWAVIDEHDVASILPGWDRVPLLPHLEALPNYEKATAEREYRCGGAHDIWKAHETALDSQLSGICHSGLEVRPGVWMGRNASVVPGAVITAPSYIGENSRIGAGAQIGPYAAIAKDCLIARDTIVRHSVVAPGTYAGDNLELDHVFADQHELFDVRLGISVNGIGHPIVDSVFDLHWLDVPRQLLAALWSATARSCVSAWGALSSAWARLSRKRSLPEEPVDSRPLRIPPHNDGAPDRYRPRRGGVV